MAARSSSSPSDPDFPVAAASPAKNPVGAPDVVPEYVSHWVAHLST